VCAEHFLAEIDQKYPQEFLQVLKTEHVGEDIL
jgi:hypothetical protein